ncbi:MAG: methanogenesis marker 9 domain-containing protein [Methanobacteriaceae archaeon]|nr:methanogenesis marker 9 domain-containing protein [Methanobacteriaceae archaeon]
MGWENAPAHVCKGGDARGLAFCCPPVKPCPVLSKLNEINLDPQEFIKIKEDFAKKTELGKGTGTCFGSLVWCCKATKPCPLRDSVLRSIKLSTDDYMTLKKQLADEIMSHVNVSKESLPDDEIQSLAITFGISFEDAKIALEESNNDMKTAIKNLRLKNL